MRDLATGATLGTLAQPAVALMALSPAQRYLVTAAKPGKDAAGEATKNLKVWRLSDFSLVQEFSLKLVSKETWPFLQWSADDAQLFHAVTNTVHVRSRAARLQQRCVAAILAQTGALCAFICAVFLHKALQRSAALPASIGCFSHLYCSHQQPCPPAACAEKRLACSKPGVVAATACAH